MRKKRSVFITRTILAFITGLTTTILILLYPANKLPEDNIKQPCHLQKDSKTFPGYLSAGSKKYLLKKCMDIISNDEIPASERTTGKTIISFTLNPKITIQKQIKGGKISFLYSDVNYVSSRGPGYQSPTIKINDTQLPFSPDRGTCRSDYSYSIPASSLKPGENTFTIHSGTFQNNYDTWAVENLTIEYYFSRPDCLE